MIKLPHNCTHLTSKVMLKILQARLPYYKNSELPDVRTGFRKGRGTKDQIANIRWIIEKARQFRKTPISALLTMLKPVTVWITTNCGKFLKRWEYQTTLPASWEICMQVKKQLSWWLRQQSVCLQCGRPRFDPWWARSPGEGNGNPLQYSCLENSMDG